MWGQLASRGTLGVNSVFKHSVLGTRARQAFAYALLLTVANACTCGPVLWAEAPKCSATIFDWSYFRFPHVQLCMRINSPVLRRTQAWFQDNLHFKFIQRVLARARLQQVPPSAAAATSSACARLAAACGAAWASGACRGTAV